MCFFKSASTHCVLVHLLTSHTLSIVKRGFVHANYHALHISNVDWVRVLPFSIICEIWRLALASLNRPSQLRSVQYEFCFNKRINTLAIVICTNFFTLRRR